MKLLLSIFMLMTGCTYKLPVPSGMAMASNPVKLSTYEQTKNPDEIWVMVIDSGIGPHLRLKSHVQYKEDDDNYVDNIWHGTHVTGIVIYGNKLDEGFSDEDEVCPNVKIFSCKTYDPKWWHVSYLTKSIECVKTATKFKMDYINYSGAGLEFSKKEYEAYRNFIASGGRAFVAMGNEGEDLRKTKTYPAAYAFSDTLPKHFKRLLKLYSVQNINKEGNFAFSSSRHPLGFSEIGENILSTMPYNEYAKVSGTSQATPALLHYFLKKRCEEINDGRKN